jgi:hypothetical protein
MLLSKLNKLRRGTVDIASASGTEDPGSNPARVLGFLGSHSKAVVYICTSDLMCIFLCVAKEKSRHCHKNKKPFIQC